MEKTNLVLIGYAIYLPLTLALTLYVSQTLFKNGKQFMLDIFHGESVIALSTNRLFQVGFYLLNIGFAFNNIRLYSLNDAQDLVESLSVKVGGFSIWLGVTLMLNLFLFLRGRKRSRQMTA